MVWAPHHAAGRMHPATLMGAALSGGVCTGGTCPGVMSRGRVYPGRIHRGVIGGLVPSPALARPLPWPWGVVCRQTPHLAAVQIVRCLIYRKRDEAGCTSAGRPTRPKAKATNAKDEIVPDARERPHTASAARTADDADKTSGAPTRRPGTAGEACDTYPTPG